MADWKVSAERLEIFDHPNADSLHIAKVGMFQLVVGKANGYKTGDIVVFAPKRSVLPTDLRANYTNTETGKSYLVGPEHDRVSSIRLRGEPSEGATIPAAYAVAKLGLNSVADLVIGEDISKKLGISLYEPPIPAGFGGELRRLTVDRYTTHDVEQLAIYAHEFTRGEPIVMTEKIHGSQCALLISKDGTPHVSSKGFFSKGIEILEDAGNIYWCSIRNTKLIDILVAAYPGVQVQAFAESFPVQGQAWSYGAADNKPLLRVFRLLVDGREMPIAEARAAAHALAELWTPILYEGPFDVEALRGLAKGKEQVSGKELHKREGGVITPVIPRNSSENWNLSLKNVASDFKDGDDALS